MTITLRPLLWALLLLPTLTAAAPFGRVHALAGLDDGVVLATSEGVYRLNAERQGTHLSDAVFTALAPLRERPGQLLGAGKQLMRSDDGGRTWQAVPGAPAGIVALATTRAAPGRVYALADALYVSADSGRSWTRTGAPPGATESLTASQTDPTSVYVAGAQGPYVSRDAGRSWQPASLWRLPAPLVATSADGRVYAFLWGQGLLRTQEPALSWEVLFNGFGGQAVTGLAGADGMLFATTTADKLFVSTNGGTSWQPYVQPSPPATDAERRGERLFAQNCVGCHGERGIGETPRLGQQQPLAPALDETAHAWHHGDEQLIGTILNGGPQRMPAWRGALSRADAADLVAYIKSLWDERALRCQGPAHMSADCRR